MERKLLIDPILNRVPHLESVNSFEKTLYSKRCTQNATLESSSVRRKYAREEANHLLVPLGLSTSFTSRKSITGVAKNIVAVQEGVGRP